MNKNKRGNLISLGLVLGLTLATLGSNNICARANTISKTAVVNKYDKAIDYGKSVNYYSQLSVKMNFNFLRSQNLNLVNGKSTAIRLINSSSQVIPCKISFSKSATLSNSKAINKADIFDTVILTPIEMEQGQRYQIIIDPHAIKGAKLDTKTNKFIVYNSFLYTGKLYNLKVLPLSVIRKLPETMPYTGITNGIINPLFVDIIPNDYNTAIFYCQGDYKGSLDDTRFELWKVLPNGMGEKVVDKNVGDVQCKCTRVKLPYGIRDVYNYSYGREIHLTQTNGGSLVVGVNQKIAIKVPVSESNSTYIFYVYNKSTLFWSDLIKLPDYK